MQLGEARLAVFVKLLENLINWKDRKEKHRRLLELQIFLVKVATFSILIYMVVFFGVDMTPIQLEVARESAWLLGVSGFNSTVAGTGVNADTPKGAFFFVISQDCTGWKSMVFLLALIIAVPKRTWKAKLVGIAADFAVLWIINLLRIVIVVSAFPIYGYEIAMLIHDYLWEIGLGIAAFALWVVWLWFSKRPEEDILNPKQ